MITSFDVFFYTCAFIIPGFIIHSIISSLIPQRKMEGNLLIYQLILYTSINYAIWLPILNYFNMVESSTTSPIKYMIITFIMILVTPCIIGLVIVKLKDTNIVKSALLRLGYNPISSIPSAWDIKFHQKEGCWIIVTLKSEEVIHGMFSVNSHASSEMGERDIYIEEIYKINEEDKWEKFEGNKGILIKGDNIKYIEFF